VRYWNPELFSSARGAALLKLHGSTDWFRFSPDTGDWYDDRIGIAVDGDHEHTRTGVGRGQRPIDWRPLMLAARLYRRGDRSARPRPHPDCAQIHTERRQPGVTLQLLHLEYLERHPDGYHYT
jgi:hypothetical protein